MNPYILDYSDPDDMRSRAGHQTQPRKPTYLTLAWILALFSGLSLSIMMALLARQNTEMQATQERYNAQAIRYDSLLAAKLETDKRLAALCQRLKEQAHSADKP